MIAGNTINFPGEYKFAMLRLVDGALSVANAGEEMHTTIYPNPFNDHVILNITTTIVGAEIFDLTGRKIDRPRFDINDANTRFDLSQITAKGTYFLRITTSDGVVTKKIVKE